MKDIKDGPQIGFRWRIEIGEDETLWRWGWHFEATKDSAVERARKYPLVKLVDDDTDEVIIEWKDGQYTINKENWPAKGPGVYAFARYQVQT